MSDLIAKWFAKVDAKMAEEEADDEFGDVWICDVCEKRFASLKAVKQHTRDKHP